MAVALGEYFSEVKAHDIFDYGFGTVADFQKAGHPANSFDWVITNPPFRQPRLLVAPTVADDEIAIGSEADRCLLSRAIQTSHFQRSQDPF